MFQRHNKEMKKSIHGAAEDTCHTCTDKGLESILHTRLQLNRKMGDRLTETWGLRVLQKQDHEEEFVMQDVY